MSDIADRLHQMMLRSGFQDREAQEAIFAGKQEIERLRRALREILKFDPSFSWQIAKLALKDGEAANPVTLDDEWRKLITDVMAVHPGPWSKGWTCSDNGCMNDTIDDANHQTIFDGETGWMSDPVFNMLLNFPELAEDFLKSI